MSCAPYRDQGLVFPTAAQAKEFTCVIEMWRSGRRPDLAATSLGCIPGSEYLSVAPTFYVFTAAKIGNHRKEKDEMNG